MRFFRKNNPADVTVDHPHTVFCDGVIAELNSALAPYPSVSVSGDELLDTVLAAAWAEVATQFDVMCDVVTHDVVVAPAVIWSEEIDSYVLHILEAVDRDLQDAALKLAGSKATRSASGTVTFWDPTLGLIVVSVDAVAAGPAVTVKCAGMTVPAPVPSSRRRWRRTQPQQPMLTGIGVQLEAVTLVPASDIAHVTVFATQDLRVMFDAGVPYAVTDSGDKVRVTAEVATAIQRTRQRASAV
jgi:hypothetical protein